MIENPPKNKTDWSAGYLILLLFAALTASTLCGWMAGRSHNKSNGFPPYDVYPTNTLAQIHEIHKRKSIYGVPYYISYAPGIYRFTNTTDIPAAAELDSTEPEDIRTTLNRSTALVKAAHQRIQQDEEYTRKLSTELGTIIANLMVKLGTNRISVSYTNWPDAYNNSLRFNGMGDENTNGITELQLAPSWRWK